MMKSKMQKIQTLMKEITTKFIKKYNYQFQKSYDSYHKGLTYAYFVILDMLYEQAKLFEIPLEYLCLNFFDPEEVFLSNKLCQIDNIYYLEVTDAEIENKIEGWMSDNLYLLREIQEDDYYLSRVKEGRYYVGVIDGFKEIFSTLEKYGVKVNT